MKKITIFTAILICALLLASFSFLAFAEGEAEDVGADAFVSSSSTGDTAFLFDGKDGTYKTLSENTSLTFEHSGGIGSLYIMFAISPGEYTVTDNDSGESVTVGEYGFLHEYIDITALFGKILTSVTVGFQNSVKLSEIYVFTAGETPSFVQKWLPPLENKTDLLLFATHGDDDQLFFAGLLPHYAWYEGYRVQVAYLTDHRNLTEGRVHEMLNGLWAVGVTAYPVFGTYADFRIDDMEQTYKHYEKLGTTREELLGFVTEQLRRFKPLVVVGHDFDGEYGHGMHMVYADLLAKAIMISGDESEYPDSADTYGVWEIKKAYFHLYDENPINMDYDTPRDCFDGLTAFQVTQKYGYPCHLSQQYTWFTDWINGKGNSITKASEIKTYNPCEFGLYFSSVGEDVNKNDMFENIITYAEQEKLEQERLEQSIADELSRQEESRYIENSLNEEQSRLEEQSRYHEESKGLEESYRDELSRNQELARAEKQKQTVILITVSAVVIFAVILCSIIMRRIRK